VNAAAPRWAGFNLLAPTYEISARIAERLDRDIMLVLGGHQAKAMPAEILFDQRMSQCEALVIGEGETRVAALLDDHRRRNELSGVMWLDAIMLEFRMSPGALPGRWGGGRYDCDTASGSQACVASRPCSRSGKDALVNSVQADRVGVAARVRNGLIRGAPGFMRAPAPAVVLA